MATVAQLGITTADIKAIREELQCGMDTARNVAIRRNLIARLKKPGIRDPDEIYLVLITMLEYNL